MDKTHQKLFEKYISFIANNKKQPSSINSFMEELKLKEGTFYKYFSSFDQLEKDFWNVIFERTLKNIQSQEVYLSYSINEKLLSFYYSWIEELKDYREFVSFVIGEEKIYELYPSGFDLFKENFEAFSTQLVEEGVATGEIADRLYFTDKYKYGLWYQPVTIIKFWVKDKSKGFEDTDALIEKTVNFSFDLMRSNGLDSFFDLAKFHIQHF
jgi:hypothetical protein